MIKILDRKEPPRDTIKCACCGSMLEYGNEDLEESPSYGMYHIDGYGYLYKNYYIICPVCGYQIPASWIKEKE